MKRYKLTLITLIVLLNFFVFGIKHANAQYCSGGGTCVEQGFQRVCSNSGDGCSGNSDCGPGGRCVTEPIIVNEDQGTCIVGGGGTVCNAACPRGGFIGMNCGSPYYPPPPPPPRPPPPPPPPPTGCVGSECETDPPPPPEDTYWCNPCSGTCQLAAGGSTLQGCSATCTVTLDPLMCGGCTDCGSTPAGESSCADLRGTAVEDVVMPGETVTWTTWGPPPGGTALERLANASPGLITKSYTSPGNMITVAFMFRVPEGQPHNFYIYDEKKETFYFFVDEDKPVIVATRHQEVVDIAIGLGYTLVDPEQTSAGEASSIEKRVYKLIDEDVDEDPWEFPNNGPRRPVTAHMPMNNEHNIPYVNCASLFRASGHSDYYSTNLVDAYEDDSLFCFRRQPMTWRFPKDDPDDEFNETVMTGNYFGMELDWPKNMWLANQGESEGEQVWPRTNLYEGTDLYKYSDEMQFATLGKARDWENKSFWTPGFIRQAMVQLPVEFFNEGTHNLYALTHLGPGAEPVPDEDSSQGCFLNNEGDSEEIIVDPKLYGFDNSIEESYPLCNGFLITDKDTGKVVNPGDKVRRGDTYTIRTNAQAESRIFSFYNSSFNEPHSGLPNTIDNWIDNGDITTFEIVDCDNITGGCHEDNTDDQVLKVARTNGSDQASSTVQTQFIDTNKNVTGHTFSVEFWARVDGSPKVIPQVLLARSQSSKMAVPYNTLSDPADTRELRFTNYATSDLNDTTASITVTNEWQKFFGAVTFNYDTNDPSGHPNGNDSTSIQLTLKAPSGADNIYYDDVTIIGWKQPTTYFRMASAIPGDGSENPQTFDQCSQSIWADTTYTNLSGAHFWADLTIPEDTIPGTYNMFAALNTSINPDYTYFSNPNAVVNCDLNTAHWNDDLASPPLSALEACMRTVEVIACNETTPVAPTVTRVNSDVTNLPNLPTASGHAKFNDIRVSDTSLTIWAAPGGTQAQRDAVTAMSLYITPYNSADAEVLIEGTPLNNPTNEFIFTHQMTEDFTNEFTISIQSFNEDSCNSTNLLTSPELLRHIRIFRQRSGHLIEIPKEEYASYNCRDTRQSLVGKGQSDRLVDITDNSEINFTTMQMTVNTSNVEPALGSFVSTYTNDISDNFRRLYFAPTFNNYTTDLPYNPLNLDGWRNRITSFTLTLPPNNTEESYVCVQNCNPNVGTDSNPRCQAAGSLSNPYMVVPKPQYPGYAHNEYSNDLNIYVGKGNFNDAWWQSRGGLVFANGSILSNLPIFNTNPRTLCQDNMSNDVCQPYINAKRLGLNTGGSAHDSAGVVISNGTSIDAPGSYITQRVSTSDQRVESATTATNTEDFTHFWEELITDHTKVTALGGTLSTKPTGAVDYDSNVDENVRVYSRGTVAANQNLFIDLSGSNAISVPAGEKIIVVVNGNLNIGGDSSNMFNKITVAPGGFLAFIVSGNIVIESAVGTNVETETRPVIEGVYLAGGTLTVQSTDPAASDKKFIGRGSFIGLTGVDLQREYDNDNDPFAREKNSYSPIEQFIFSPTLIAATPNLIREANLTWEETN